MLTITCRIETIIDMGMFDFLKSRSKLRRNEIQDAIAAEIKSLTLKSPGPLQEWISDMIGAKSGEVTLPYKESVWVYRCINIWNQVSHVPLLLKDKDGKQVDSGPDKFLLDSPASDMNTSTMIEYLILSLGTAGEFFILREDGTQTNKNVLPKYLTIVHPSSMSLDKETVDRNGKVQAWILSTGSGNRRKIPVDAVIHEMLPNPYDAHRGMAPVTVLKQTLAADYAARKHNKWMMERHGQVAGVVTIKDAIGSERLTLLHNLWAEKYEGAKNAGKTAFLDSGAEYKPLASTSKDMDWEAGQKLSREEICAAFGVPPNNAGILDKATYSNFEQSTKSLWEETLIPLGARIQDVLNKYIFLPSTKNAHRVEFDFVNTVKILQEDETAKIDRYIKLVTQGMMTPKHAAELCRIKLGDPDPAHDIIWGSPMLIPVTDISSQAGDTQPAIPPSPAADPTNPAGTLSQDQKRLPATHCDSEIHTPNINKGDRYELRQARGRSIIRQAAGYERQLREALKRYFRTQHQTIKDNLAKITAHMKAQAAPGAVIKAKQTPAEIADLLLKGKDWNAELLKRCRPILRAAGILSAKNTLAEIGRPKTSFREETLREFFKAQEKLIVKVNETTRDGLIDAAKTMTESLAAGESPEQAAAAMTGKIDAAFGRSEESRRVTIARTETLRVVNGARFEEMKDSKIEKHEWLAVMDDAVRDSHAKADGEVVKIGTKFSNGLKYPGDPAGDVSETANCRCTTVAYFGD